MQTDAGNAPPDDYEYLSQANLEKMSSIKSSALRSQLTANKSEAGVLRSPSK